MRDDKAGSSTTLIPVYNARVEPARDERNQIIGVTICCLFTHDQISELPEMFMESAHGVLEHRSRHVERSMSDDNPGAERTVAKSGELARAAIQGYYERKASEAKDSRERWELQRKADEWRAMSVARPDGQAYAQGVRRGRLDGLKRARDLARDGLHVDPRTSIRDFIVAIELIIAEEAARAGR